MDERPPALGSARQDAPPAASPQMARARTGINRRGFITSLAAAVPFARFASPAQAQSVRFVTPATPPVPGTLDIGDRRQLFLDDRLVAEATRIAAFTRRPDKAGSNPILTADREWEIGDAGPDLSGIQITGQAVLYDDEEKLFKMWYLANIASPHPGEQYARRPLCYAISRDGLKWEKPELGLIEFRGSRRNNIVGDWADPQFFNFIKDPQDPDPSRRYKAMGEMEGSGAANRNGGVAVAFSPDGIRWTPYSGNPVVHHGRNLADAPTMLGWDPRLRKYVGYFRPGPPLAPEIYGVGLDRRQIRSYGYALSDDFVNWTPTELMMAPDAADAPDVQYMQFTAGIDGDFYVGFNHVYKTTELVWDVYLMTSRDGFHWNWIDRSVPWFPRGEVGSYDACYMTLSGPIFHDDRVWVYYGGYSGAHSRNRGRFGDRVMSINLCTLPRDRWMGLMAGPFRGTLVTRPLLFKGRKLMIDIEASTGQQVPREDGKLRFENAEFRVALEGPSGGAIDGFGLDRSSVLLRSGRQEVSWRGSDLSQLAGQAVRLRCEYRNAVLYSVQFADR